MRDEKQTLYYSEYKNQKRMYYWFLTKDEKGAELLEFHFDPNYNKKVNNVDLPLLHCIQDSSLKEYLQGILKVKYDCFKEAQNVKDLRVTCKQNYSYRFNRGEFTNNLCSGKKVTFRINPNMKLYEVTQEMRQKEVEPGKYEVTQRSEKWLLVAKEGLEQCNEVDGITIEPVDTKLIRRNFGYNICVEYNQERENDQTSQEL